MISLTSPRLEGDRSDQLAPCFEVLLDSVGELLRCVYDRLEAQRHQTILHVGQRDDPGDFTIEQIDYLFRRAGRHKDSHPRVTLYFWISGFRDGWNGG